MRGSALGGGKTPSLSPVSRGGVRRSCLQGPYRDEDGDMRGGSQWWALVWGIGLAAGGGGIAYALAGGPAAAVGAVVGAVAGAFAPAVYDGIRTRSAKRQAWRQMLELPVPKGPARVLDPRLEVVGFIGREHELAALVEWCGDNRATPLRLVTGPGGVGKTRLAVELSARLAASGWRCERISDGQEGEAIAALRRVTRGRALLVVDYAETRVRLKQMLTALTSDDGAGVRVLLLARSPGEWWDQLGVGEPAVWDLVQAAASAGLELSPVIDAELPDAEIVAQAVRSFARELSLPEKLVEIYGGDTNRRRVLDLHIAALIAVLDESSTEIVRVDIRTVLAELLRHEQHFWYDSARTYGLSVGPTGMSVRTLRQIVAVSCLLGAATEQEARELPRRIPGLSASARIAGWLRELYPPHQNDLEWLGLLQPDRLAEWHVVRELVASPELAEACLTDLNGRQALNAVTLLARASADDTDAEEMLSRLLPNVARNLNDLNAPLEILMAIFNVIPYPTITLASVAVAISQRIITLLPQDTPLVVRAYLLHNLGIRLGEQGRPAEALPFFQEALDIRAGLAAEHPDPYGYHRVDLADSLTDRGIAFSELGRAADALSATEEAVSIYRELAVASPDRYRPGLARSLDNLGSRLAEVGRPAAALQIIQEAVKIYRELTTVNPESYGPGLANSLENLAIRVAKLDRLSEALPAAREVVKIRRKLTAISPDRYRADLAVSLTNLGDILGNLGRPAEALSVFQEALAIRREVAAINPERYHTDLAQSLTSLGAWFMKLERLPDAVSVIEEAVEIYREWATSNADKYRADLAAWLTYLGALLSELGRSTDALPIAQEAVSIRRELAEAGSDPYRYDLATSLDNVGVMMARLRRLEDALPIIQESVQIYRDLAAVNPDLYRREFAISLSNLAALLGDLGRPTDALPIAREAVESHRKLTAATPDRDYSGLVASLTNLAAVLASLGRKADAKAARREAAKLRNQAP
jgi:tetratricopeptide (TPR) repeat protein